MKTYSAGLTAALTGEGVVVSDLAIAVVITLTNDEVVRIAEVYVDTEISAHVFSPAPGLKRSAIEYRMNEGSMTMELEFQAYVGGPIAYSDVQYGLYDNAEVGVYAFLRDAVTPVLDPLFWGRVTNEPRGSFGFVECTLEGPLGAQTEFINKFYQGPCRHRFTSPECGIDPASVTFAGTVVSADSRFIEVSGTGGQASDFFNVGLFTVTSGRLKNHKREIKTSTLTGGNQVLELYRDFGGIDPPVAATCLVRRGCTHDFSPTQGNRFYNNARRYGGEPRHEADSNDVIHKTAGEDA